MFLNVSRRFMTTTLANDRFRIVSLFHYFGKHFSQRKYTIEIYKLRAEAVQTVLGTRKIFQTTIATFQALVPCFYTNYCFHASE